MLAGGSTGWQAPEQLILRSGGEARQGRSVDIFTFGLLIFYCLSGGQHPFGEGIERDYRILNVSSRDCLRKPSVFAPGAFCKCDAHKHEDRTRVANFDGASFKQEKRIICQLRMW